MKPSDVMRNAVARIIAPEWFPDRGGKSILENYPGQTDKYQEVAKAKADEIFGLLESAGYLK
jgi:hypothetical protein